MSNDKIVSLIAKLKRLSENNENLEEAQLAAARMQELIEKYNIQEAELSIGEIEEVEKNELYKEKGKNMTRWKLSLATGLANLNTCKVVFSAGYNYYDVTVPGKVYIYGQVAKVTVVQYMFSYLTKEIERLSKKSIQDGYGSGKAYANSFKVGATYAILDRLKETKTNMKKEYSENALIKVNKDIAKLNDFLSNLNLKKTKMNNRATDLNGYADGVVAGNQINLNSGKPIGSGNKSMKK